MPLARDEETRVAVTSSSAASLQLNNMSTVQQHKSGKGGKCW